MVYVIYQGVDLYYSRGKKWSRLDILANHLIQLLICIISGVKERAQVGLEQFTQNVQKALSSGNIPMEPFVFFLLRYMPHPLRPAS